MTSEPLNPLSNEIPKAVRRIVQYNQQTHEEVTQRLEDLQICLNEVAEILDLLCKSQVISDQVDLRYRGKILQDLEDFKGEILNSYGCCKASSISINKDLQKVSQDLQEITRYLRKLCNEDSNGKSLTGWAWLGAHLMKGAQGALAGIIVALLYYFLRYGLPKIMNWH